MSGKVDDTAEELRKSFIEAHHLLLRCLHSISIYDAEKTITAPTIHAFGILLDYYSADGWVLDCLSRDILTSQYGCREFHVEKEPMAYLLLAYKLQLGDVFDVSIAIQAGMNYYQSSEAIRKKAPPPKRLRRYSNLDLLEDGGTSVKQTAVPDEHLQIVTRLLETKAALIEGVMLRVFYDLMLVKDESPNLKERASPVSPSHVALNIWRCYISEVFDMNQRHKLFHILQDLFNGVITEANFGFETLQKKTCGVLDERMELAVKLSLLRLFGKGRAAISPTFVKIISSRYGKGGEGFLVLEQPSVRPW